MRYEKKQIEGNDIWIGFNTLEGLKDREQFRKESFANYEWGLLDNRYKNGFQASLGEFAGRWCRIAPLRSTLREALKDCFEFMKAHNDKRLLRIQLDEQDFAQNYATSIF